MDERQPERRRRHHGRERTLLRISRAAHRQRWQRRLLAGLEHREGRHEHADQRTRALEPESLRLLVQERKHDLLQRQRHRRRILHADEHARRHRIGRRLVDHRRARRCLRRDALPRRTAVRRRFVQLPAHARHASQPGSSPQRRRGSGRRNLRNLHVRVRHERRLRPLRGQRAVESALAVEREGDHHRRSGRRRSLPAEGRAQHTVHTVAARRLECAGRRVHRHDRRSRYRRSGRSSRR